jgi:hypothetical protein
MDEPRRRSIVRFGSRRLLWPIHLQEVSCGVSERCKRPVVVVAAFGEAIVVVVAFLLSQVQATGWQQDTENVEKHLQKAVL